MRTGRLPRCWRIALLAALITSLAWTQASTAPKYSVDSIVHGATFHHGDFATNTFISIFGEGLAWSTRSVKQGDLQGNVLPTALGGVQVLIGPTKGFLVFVSPEQINVLVDSHLVPGEYDLRVLRDAWAGQPARIRISNAAPGLFWIQDGRPVVTRPDGSLVTAENPAHPGEIVILWATGLGPTLPSFQPGELPRGAATLQDLATFQVTLNETLVPAPNILYAGVAPGFAGLYQINLLLPEDVGLNPEIRVGFPDAMSVSSQTIFVEP